MSKEVKELVEKIISELDGRKGFDFYDIDGDILDEIKDELVKLILPVVSKSVTCENCEKSDDQWYCTSCYEKADESLPY